MPEEPDAVTILRERLGNDDFIFSDNMIVVPVKALKSVLNELEAYKLRDRTDADIEVQPPQCECGHWKSSHKEPYQHYGCQAWWYKDGKQVICPCTEYREGEKK